MNQISLKYDLYEEAVQAPEFEIEFIQKAARVFGIPRPHRLKEDFCGTFYLSSEWVKSNPKNTSTALDLDPVPLAYGAQKHFAALSPDQQRRLDPRRQDVRRPVLKNFDVNYAGNFSYFLFQDRAELKRYFQAVYRSLRLGGIFLFDVVGGSEIRDPNLERTRKRHPVHGAFTYVWELKRFDILTHRAEYAIHFQLPGGKWMKNAFRYDWRNWSLPELREVLKECGFGRIEVFCEGETRSGDGDGVFRPVKSDKESASWIAIIVAQK